MDNFDKGKWRKGEVKNRGNGNGEMEDKGNGVMDNF